MRVVEHEVLSGIRYRIWGAINSFSCLISTIAFAVQVTEDSPMPLVPNSRSAATASSRRPLAPVTANHPPDDVAKRLSLSHCDPLVSQPLVRVRFVLISPCEVRGL